MAVDVLSLNIAPYRTIQFALILKEGVPFQLAWLYNRGVVLIIRLAGAK